MSWLSVIEVVTPAFVLVLMGFLFGRFADTDIASLTNVVVYLAAPALIFTSLASGPWINAEMGAMALGSLVLVLGVGLIVRLIAAFYALELGALYLPAMFMNSGNMLLPLSLFAFGEEGLRLSVVVFVTVAVLQSSLGVIIASGRLAPQEILRLPYVYAVAAAFAVHTWGIELSPSISRPVSLLGDMAVPLMLLALGLRLRSVEIHAWRQPLLVSLARIGGGYLVALAFIEFTGLSGVARSCLILAAVMPSAVINFVFAEKYANEAGDVATAIAVSTVVSLITTPLALAFAL